MRFSFINLRYLSAMRRRREYISNPVIEAASTAPIISDQSAELSPEFRPTRNCSGSFTSCEDCGLSIPREISEANIAALLRFFLTVDQWDRDAGEETVFTSPWERIL